MATVTAWPARAGEPLDRPIGRWQITRACRPDGRLGKANAALVDWRFFTIDGKDIRRVSIDPSDHPVFEKKGDTEIFWWRTPVSIDRIDDPDQRALVIARRWGA